MTEEITKEITEVEVQEVDNRLTVLIKEQSLDKTTSQTILEGFSDLFERANQYEIKARAILVTDISQKDSMKEARKLRLEIKDIRTSAETTRKRLKDQSLRLGKAIDGIANVIKAVTMPIEEYLEQQEKFEDVFNARVKEELRATRYAKLKEIDPSLSFVERVGDFVTLTDYMFEIIVCNEITLKEKKAETERQAEAARVAEAERIRLQAEENERLRKEAEEREAVIAAERAEAERKQKAIENEARIQREEAERKAKAEREELERIAAEQQAQQQAIIDEQKRENDRLIKEAEEKKIAEQKAIAEQKKAEAKAKRAPDRDKLIAFADEIESLVRKIPVLKSSEYISVVKYAQSTMLELSSHIKNEVEE